MFVHPDHQLLKLTDTKGFLADHQEGVFKEFLPKSDQN